MDTEEQNVFPEPSEAGRIAKTAVKTAWWFCVVAALFCVLFVTVFPYTSMRLYFDAGNKAKTLDSAERVIARASPGGYYYAGGKNPAFDTKIADALCMAVNLSGESMDETLAKYGEGYPKTV
ncbi:MAG: hypothetical protein FWD58_11215, partial [Firmicutes bacterium]|nr:hypothetical protein [Bacillota bacterium]